jgi:hypothetical protein
MDLQIFKKIRNVIINSMKMKKAVFYISII